MSFPRKLHILVIEDEQDPIDGYRQLLALVSEEFPHVEPVVARSYSDAKALLEGPHIFHLVILDLNLPLAAKAVPPDGLESGGQLLEMMAQRDDYPIPVVLVISGKLNLARLPDLKGRLGRDFWYGEMFNKGLFSEDDLKKGLHKAHEYIDVGIHIRDASREWFPTISPREEDLLRRCVLVQQHCLGVDLEWWGAESGSSLSRPSPEVGPTKVLMGRFLLDDGMELSRPTFFKFEPAGNAPYACRDAGILNQKLIHVKVQHSLASRKRSLLVTQSVTNSRPVPLDQYLRGNPTSVREILPDLVNDICNQLNQLGRSTPDKVPLNQLLWRHHDRSRIEEVWNRADIRQMLKAGTGSPLVVFDRLRSNTKPVWYTRRSCTHGDLNATNVAVDPRAPARPQAFIFDAAGIHADVDTRDLAVLEVTSLLFTSGGDIHQHFLAYQLFYIESISPGEISDDPTLPALVRNTRQLLAAIRQRVQQTDNPQVYPLLVFDTVMSQLGGLAIQMSRNKIAHPLHALYLASWVSAWLSKVSADILT